MPDFAKALRHLRTPASPQRHLFQADNPVTSLTQQFRFLKARPGLPMGNQLMAAPVSSAVESLPPGVDEVTPYGRHYLVRNVYGDDHYHGKVRLDRFSCPDLRRLMKVMREKGTVPDRDGILFLDTETTGMQGGTGMVPFMVGAGFFAGPDFHMLQYFIRDFDEEPSMLHALSRLLERFQLVVTYNGGSFDIPLLETRFRLARMDSPFTALSHLDLLTGARRLWRNGHGSCRLVALERGIVSFPRGPDVPGAMIPRTYFNFLQHGPSAVLTGVFTHNVYDVVSLAALTVCACDRVAVEPAAFDEPLDLYSLARILENTQEWQRCVSLYEMALAGGLPEPARMKAEENLAVICRRLGEHDRAFAICRKLFDRSTFSLVGYEGAAIYYERVAGDNVLALEVVENALARLETSPETSRWRKLLHSRRERLKQKVIQFDENLEAEIVPL